MSTPVNTIVANDVQLALAEDIGTGDVHEALVDSDQFQSAHVVTRSSGILCGQHWVEETCRQASAHVQVTWNRKDGDPIVPNEAIVKLYGPCAVLLRIERTLLNFLQLLSGTATRVNEFASLIKHTKVRILDTRKTIPGLRWAQKYAVKIGGGDNHRFGLYDAFLIKENHIIAAGSISLALARARAANPLLFLEIEVETLSELETALAGRPNRIMLDNFSIDDMRKAVLLVKQFDRAENTTTQLEASGQINRTNIIEVAETGVNFVSLGTLTKDVQALDFSLRFE